MRSKTGRVALLCLFLVTTGVTAYGLWNGETLGRREANAARQFEYTAFATEHDVLDLRASQQAYVAAGQGDEFWIPRTAGVLNGVRSALGSLRAQAVSPEAQSNIDNASSALDDFERMDRRAREYTRSGQRLLASDLIFVDGLESTGAMLASLHKARTAENQAHEAALAATRRTEAMGLAITALVSLAVVALLVPRPGVDEGVRNETVSEPADSAPLGAFDLRPALALAPPRAEPAAEPAPSTPSVDLDTVASVCTDLARVTDTRALPAILGRAASVLDAPGIVLWIADPDGRELSPIVTHGYSPKMVTRLGTILRDAENVTASAFRTALIQTVDTDAVSNGAIAAPLVTPAGCVGVMAAEVRAEGEKDSGKLAAAAIVAAQLATLVGPPSTRAQARADAG
jgi:hypothetical protein